MAHGEGIANIASGRAAHVEGRQCTASNNNTHAEGYNTIASGLVSHAEGNSTEAKANYSHAEGSHTQNNNEAEHAEGKYNVSISGSTIHTVGIGTSTQRKNAHTITTEGKHYIPGIGTYTGTETTLPTGQDLATVISNLKQTIQTLQTDLQSTQQSLAQPVLLDLTDFRKNIKTAIVSLIDANEEQTYHTCFCIEMSSLDNKPLMFHALRTVLAIEQLELFNFSTQNPICRTDLEKARGEFVLEYIYKYYLAWMAFAWISREDESVFNNIYETFFPHVSFEEFYQEIDKMEPTEQQVSEWNQLLTQYIEKPAYYNVFGLQKMGVLDCQLLLENKTDPINYFGSIITNNVNYTVLFSDNCIILSLNTIESFTIDKNARYINFFNTDTETAYQAYRYPSYDKTINGDSFYCFITEDGELFFLRDAYSDDSSAFDENWTIYDRRFNTVPKDKFECSWAQGGSN